MCFWLSILHTCRHLYTLNIIDNTSLHGSKWKTSTWGSQQNSYKIIHYSYISTLQTLADRYIMHMHIRVQLISSLSCQVSCVHQLFSCAWMCKHKNAVALCGAILIRPFSGHWVRIFNGKQNANVWIMRPNISDINSRCYVAWNPLNWPPDTAHTNRRYFESGRNWQLRPPVVPRVWCDINIHVF